MNMPRCKIICQALGHRYNTPHFQANTLYHCARCGEEMLGRTWDDLEPMSQEEMENWYYDPMADYQKPAPLTPSFIWGAIALFFIFLALWAVTDPIGEARPTIDPLPCPAYVCPTPSYISTD